MCRIRISEGFHYAASGEGIVNMVTELPMKVSGPVGRALGGRSWRLKRRRNVKPGLITTREGTNHTKHSVGASLPFVRRSRL